MEMIVIVALLLSLVGCLPYIGVILAMMLGYAVLSRIIVFLFGPGDE